MELFERIRREFEHGTPSTRKTIAYRPFYEVGLGTLMYEVEFQRTVSLFVAGHSQSEIPLASMHVAGWPLRRVAAAGIL